MSEFIHVVSQGFMPINAPLPIRILCSVDDRLVTDIIGPTSEQLLSAIIQCNIIEAGEVTIVLTQEAMIPRPTRPMGMSGGCSEIPVLIDAQIPFFLLLPIVARCTLPDGTTIELPLPNPQQFLSFILSCILAGGMVSVRRFVR